MALTTLKSKRRPRTRNQIFDVITVAQRLYLETGGNDIDFNIEAARRQVARCERYAEHPPEGQHGRALGLLNTAIRELRTAEQMREKKLAACTRMIEELSYERDTTV